MMFSLALTVCARFKNKCHCVTVPAKNNRCGESKSKHPQAEVSVSYFSPRKHFNNNETTSVGENKGTSRGHTIMPLPCMCLFLYGLQYTILYIRPVSSDPHQVLLLSQLKGNPFNAITGSYGRENIIRMRAL